MTIDAKDQRIILKNHSGECLLDWVNTFLVDRKALIVAPGTLEFYHEKLMPFVGCTINNQVAKIPESLPNLIWGWLLLLTEKGHNPGGKLTEKKGMAGNRTFSPLLPA